MVRSLDFTVEQDTTYRFRLRVVVRNPNLNREDVAAGVDTTSPELFGPWSEPTDEVTMPADVTAYAVRKTPSASPGSEQVQFQVTRWNPEDGFTTVRDFNAGPGQIIGEPRTPRSRPPTARAPRTRGSTSTAARSSSTRWGAISRSPRCRAWSARGSKSPRSRS